MYTNMKKPVCEVSQGFLLHVDTVFNQSNTPHTKLNFLRNYNHFTTSHRRTETKKLL